MEIKNAITHLRQGGQKLVHKVEKDLMKGVKYLNNCVMKYWNRSIKQILHDKVVKFIVFFWLYLTKKWSFFTKNGYKT
jgi:hypothetical protein